MFKASLVIILGTCMLMFAFKEPDYAAEIQKDPLFIEYMELTSQNDFSSKLNFPVVPGAAEKRKQAVANGTLIEYLKAVKDVNGVSWYDAVAKPQYKRVALFGKVCNKYLRRYGLSYDFIKEAAHEYRSKHRRC